METPSSSADVYGEDGDQDSSLDLTCPGCAQRLSANAIFAKYRICPSCARHFWMPARERLELLVDAGTFRETNAELISLDPLVFRDALPLPDRMTEIRDGMTYPIRESLVTGTARFGGLEAVLIVLDFALLGDEIGVVAGEKLVLALELAATRRLPLIAACSAGGHRSSGSMSSLVQSVRIASAIARVQRNGVPFIGILSDPTAGAVFSGFASHAHLIFAEPGSRIGMTIPRSLGAPIDHRARTESAERLISHGMLDGIVDRRNLREHLVTLLDILVSRGSPRVAAAGEATAVAMVTSARELSVARHPERPMATDYVRRLMPGFVELHGDRSGGDDQHVHIGLGQLDGVSLGVISVDRMLSPDGESPPVSLISCYRKAIRLLRLVSLLEMPVVTFIDGLDHQHSESEIEAEAGATLALLARTVTSVPIPTIAVVLGEVSGPHAVALAASDRTLMVEHAVFATASPEVARPATASQWSSAKPVVLSARDCRRFGIVDSVIPEPGNGAHEDPALAAQFVRLAVSRALGELAGLGPRRLQDDRARKFRQLGLAGAESPEAVRHEIAQLVELQRTVGRSIDDLRDRIDLSQRALPSFPHLPSRPGMPAAIWPSLPSLRRPAMNRAEIADLAGKLASTGRDFAERVNDARSNLGGPESPVAKDDGSSQPEGAPKRF